MEFAAGKASGFSVPELLELIHLRAGIRSVELGRIECGSDITIVNTTKSLAERIIASMEPGDPEVRECAAGPRKRDRGGNRRGGDHRSVDGGFRRERRREAFQERRTQRGEGGESSSEHSGGEFRERKNFRRNDRPSRRDGEEKKPFWEKFRKRRSNKE